MRPYYEHAGITIYHGDCREVLPTLADKFDACLTDPPYHLTQASRNGSPRQNDPETPFGRTKLGGAGFMGKTWDGGDVAFRRETWEAVSGVLKPGAHVLAFGGTRTFHRLTCAIEDAGFEIRDVLMWLYGSGFPKSLNISKAIDKRDGLERPVLSTRAEHNICRPKGGGDERFMTSAGNREEKLVSKTVAASERSAAWEGFGTALKPAWEPVILGMRPLDGAFADNATKHEVAGLNIDGSRIATDDSLAGSHKPPFSFKGENSRPFHSRSGEASAGKRYTDVGSTNFAATPGPRGGDPSGRWPANVLLDEQAAAALDEQAGVLTSGANPTQRSSDKFRNTYAPYAGQECSPLRGADNGGASRFFYTAKADSTERGTGNNHPTVKPLDLMRYLCRLLAPPSGGLFLEPFAGSGTTLVACKALNIRAVGIEICEEYCEIAAKRLSQEVLELTEASA